MKRDGFRRMLVGMGSAAVVCTVLCGIAALLIGREIVAEKWLDGLAAAALGLAVSAGAGIAGGGWAGIGTGIGLWLILVLCGCAGAQFQFERAGQNLLVCMAGAGAGSMLCMNKNYAGRKHRKRRIVKVNKKLQ